MRLIVFLLSLTIFTGFLEAQEKKTAALAPLASMGDLDEIQKRVIFNTLQESLSKYYILSSQKMYERAEEEAFQQMDASECTEDQCIAIIQELLQVEYFFMFEILQSDDFQQLKITRVDLDGNRDVRTTTCESCKISQTNSKVDQLVLSIFEIYNAIDNKIVTTNNQTTRELGASAFWEMIKDSEDKLKYQDFINKFPESSFRIAAQTKIDEINRKEKEFAEDQKRIAEEKERKNKIAEERQKKVKNKLASYWENKKCEKFSFEDNFYTAEIFLLTRPYGVNSNTGKLIKNKDEADRLSKSNELLGNQNGGTKIEYLRYGGLLFSYFATFGYITSFIFNTECYQTRRNLKLTKKFIKYNYEFLEEDLAQGNGNYLNGVYTTYGCQNNEFHNINHKMKKTYYEFNNQSSYKNVKINNLVRKIDC